MIVTSSRHAYFPTFYCDGSVYLSCSIKKGKELTFFKALFEVTEVEDRSIFFKFEKLKIYSSSSALNAAYKLYPFTSCKLFVSLSFYWLYSIYEIDFSMRLRISLVILPLGSLNWAFSASSKAYDSR